MTKNEEEKLDQLKRKYKLITTGINTNIEQFLLEMLECFEGFLNSSFGGDDWFLFLGGKTTLLGRPISLQLKCCSKKGMPLSKDPIF